MVHFNRKTYLPLYLHRSRIHGFAHLFKLNCLASCGTLANGEWPLLNKLKLFIPLAKSASIQQITAAPQLEELDFGLIVLTTSHLDFLVTKEWPLEVLRCQLSHYMSANYFRAALSTLQQTGVLYSQSSLILAAAQKVLT